MYSTLVNHPSSRLEVCDFRTRVHLGVSAEERAFAQEVAFDLVLSFRQAPAGTQTDRLEDTVCYASLCETVERTATERPYQLIEALARAVYEDLLKVVQPPHSARLVVTVHKIHTPIPHLRGGARFTYGDSLA